MQKKRTWETIRNEFAQACPHASHFEKKQAQTLWKNIKARAKAEIAQHKLTKSRTGGGPPPTPVKDLYLQISGRTVLRSSTFNRDLLLNENVLPK